MIQDIQRLKGIIARDQTLDNDREYDIVKELIRFYDFYMKTDLQDMSEEQICVIRQSDMNPEITLKLTRENDGDIVVSIDDSSNWTGGTEYQLCSSGSRSPRTLKALRDLFNAIHADNYKE